MACGEGSYGDPLDIAFTLRAIKKQLERLTVVAEDMKDIMDRRDEKIASLLKDRTNHSFDSGSSFKSNWRKEEKSTPKDATKSKEDLKEKSIVTRCVMSSQVNEGDMGDQEKIKREIEKNEVEQKSEKNKSETKECEMREKQKEGGIEKKGSFYAKESEVRVAYLAKQSILVFIYKEAFLNTNSLDPSLPNSICVLMQEGRPIAYFSDKLNGVAPKYPTYGNELNTLKRELENWPPYLWPTQFVSQWQMNSKLVPKGNSPPQVIENNAYKIDHPVEYNVTNNFNVSDLSPYDVGNDSRTNLFEERGYDENQRPKINHSKRHAHQSNSNDVLQNANLTNHKIKGQKVAKGVKWAESRHIN